MDEEGEVVLHLTEEKLQKIADTNNQKIEETGDEVPIIIGHTKDDVKEHDQPEIVGWARNFKVKKLFNSGRKAIFATCKFPKSLIETIKKYPRRSVELWLQKNLIDPIALLGATTPERHLGLLKFSSGGHVIETESPTEEPMEHEELVNAVLDALKKTDVWQFMEQKMSEEAGGQDEPIQDEMGGEGDLPPPDSEGEGNPMPEGDDNPPPDDVFADEEPETTPKKMGAGCASGTSTFIPGGEKKRMQAEQERGHLYRLKAQHQAAVEENRQLKVKLSAVNREKDLIQLENEGYQFDRAEELEYVTGMGKDAYQKHLDLIRKRYKAAPISRLRAQSYGSPGPIKGGDQERAKMAVKIAGEKGISYAAALSEIETGTTKVF